MKIPNGNQMGFAFDEPCPEVQIQVRPQAVAAAPKIVHPPASPAALPPTLKASPVSALAIGIALPEAHVMALALEQHPDYRVLRRLVPARSFEGAAEGSVLRLLILDTETTGLNPSRDKIVELALLGVDVCSATGRPVGPVEVYDGLEDPGMPMPLEAGAITGITDDMLRGQRLDEARIAHMLAGADLVLAHNAGFDRPFVEARLPQFSQVNWACSFADIDWKHEGRGSAKLSALAMELGWFYDAHRAEMDCHALLAVLAAVLPVSGRAGLLHLIECARAPTFRLQASGAPFDAKDTLKGRGYRWDAAAKVWHTRVAGLDALEAECQWLKAEVFAGRTARVQCEQLDALTRYSARPGKLELRDL